MFVSCSPPTCSPIFRCLYPVRHLPMALTQKKISFLLLEALFPILHKAGLKLIFKKWDQNKAIPTKPQSFCRWEAWVVGLVQVSSTFWQSIFRSSALSTPFCYTQNSFIQHVLLFQPFSVQNLNCLLPCWFAFEVVIVIQIVLVYMVLVCVLLVYSHFQRS